VTTRKTEPARAQATCRDRRQAKGYPSDLTDAQWQVIVVHLPAEAAGRRGRPRIWPLRRIIEAILYVDRAGCAWRYLPADFPPFLWNFFCQESSGLSRRMSMIGNSVAVAGMPI